MENKNKIQAILKKLRENDLKNLCEDIHEFLEQQNSLHSINGTHGFDAYYALEESAKEYGIEADVSSAFDDILTYIRTLEFNLTNDVDNLYRKLKSDSAKLGLSTKELDDLIEHIRNGN